MRSHAAIALACLAICLAWPGAAGAQYGHDVAWSPTGEGHVAFQAPSYGHQRIVAGFDGATPAAVWTRRTQDEVAGPVVAADAAGTAWIAWATFRERYLGKGSGSETIYTGVWVATRRSGEPVQVRQLAVAGSAPKLAVSPAGRAVVAWAVNSHNGVALAVGDAAGLGAVEVNEVPGFLPTRVGIDDSGHVVVAGQQPLDPPVEVLERAPDGRVSGPVAVAPADRRGFLAPDLAVNGAGDLVIAWRRDRPDEIAAVVRPAGGAFSAPIELARGEGSGSEGPDAGIDGRGRASVAWTPGYPPGPGRHVQVATAGTDGGPWTVESLSAIGEGGFGVRLSVAPDGGAALSWRTQLPTVEKEPDVTHLARRAPGGGFAAPERLTSPGRFGHGPAPVAAGPGGQAVAVWQEDDVRAEVERLRWGAFADAARPAQTLLTWPDNQYFALEPEAMVQFGGENARLRGRRLSISMLCQVPRLWSRCRGTMTFRVRGVRRAVRRRFAVAYGIRRVRIRLPRAMARALDRRRGDPRALSIVRSGPSDREAFRMQLDP